MKVKASLHIHTKEDFRDNRMIDYSIYDLLDRAADLKFSFLALTGHEKFVCRPEYITYAQERGITLIPGIELSIRKKHILVLNCDESIEQVVSFETLADYKKRHPEIFIIVAHPSFGPFVSLSRKKIGRYGRLFDAIEQSWYYSKYFNLNRKNQTVANRLKLPFIATADVHALEYLSQDYLEAEVTEPSVSALLAAIRNSKFSNISRPKPFWELVWFQIKIAYRYWSSFFK